MTSTFFKISSFALHGRKKGVNYVNTPFTFSAGEISERAGEAKGGVGESAERSGRGGEETP